ncbi:MAG TPA: tetratricopeptide repeat protein [Burkholderiaceae bacterium]|nr:tetratricopeptide repeat protein [Burkholderiaceae bacterium]
MLRSTSLSHRVLFILAVAGVLNVGCTTAPVSEQTDASGARAMPTADGGGRVPSSRPSKATGPMAGDSTADLPDYDLSGPLLFQLMSAEVAIQRGDLDNAYATLIALAKQTGDPRIAQRATEVAITRRDPTEALESATLWHQQAPKSSEAAQTLSALLIASNRYSDATPLLREIVGNDAQPADALQRIQRMLTRAPDRAAGFALLEDLAKPYRDDAANGSDVRLVIAAGAASAGLPKRATDEALAALKLRPDNERAVLLAAQFLARPDGKDSESGRAQALSMLKNFVDSHPKAQDARLTYARLLVADTKYADARKQFEQVLSADPENPDVLYALGVLALEAPPPRNEARRYFQRYLDVIEDSPQSGRDPDAAYLNLARIAEDEKKYDESLAWLERVSAPENEIAARTRQAIVLGRMQRVDQARKVIAETNAPNDAARTQLVMAEGQVLREARRYQESLDVLTAALTRQPNDTGLLYETAMAAEKIDQVDLMETHLRKLISLKPDDAQAYNALGYSLADRNLRLSEARDLIQQALKLSPNDAYILDSMGWVCFRLGDLGCARQNLERAYKIRPEAELGAHLGEVLWASGDREEARRVWRAAQKSEADNETLRSTLARLKVRL